MKETNSNSRLQLVKTMVWGDLLIIGLLAGVMWVLGTFTIVDFGFYLCVIAFFLLAFGLFFSPNTTGTITPNTKNPGMQFTQSAYSRQYRAPFNAPGGWLPSWMWRMVAVWCGISLLGIGSLLVYFWFP